MYIYIYIYVLSCITGRSSQFHTTEVPVDGGSLKRHKMGFFSHDLLSWKVSSLDVFCISRFQHVEPQQCRSRAEDGTNSGRDLSKFRLTGFNTVTLGMQDK